MNRLWNRTNAYTLIIVGAAVLFLLVIYPSAVQTLLALPVLLFLPGYALMAVLFSRAALGVPTRFVLSVGLSMAIIAIAGLLIHWSGLGLQVERPWIVLLIILTIEVAVLALAYYFLGFNIDLDQLQPGFDQPKMLLLVPGFLIVAIALLLASLPTPQQGLSGYTMLWLEPGTEGQTATIGVQSEEFGTRTYQLRYEFNGQIHSGPTFELEPGETRESPLHLPAEQAADLPVTVRLYQLDAPNSVYRHVVWWPMGESGQ